MEQSSPAEWIISLPGATDWHDVLVEWCECMHDPLIAWMNERRGLKDWMEIAIVASDVLDE